LNDVTANAPLAIRLINKATKLNLFIFSLL